MVVLKHRAWQLLTTCEKLVGSWPFQRRFQNHVHSFCLFFTIATMLMALCIRLVKEIGVNPVTVTENSNVSLLTIAMLVKLAMPLVHEKQRRKVYEKVAKHIDSIKDETEVLVLRRFSDAGLRFAFVYTAVIAGTSAFFIISPSLKNAYNSLAGINKLESVIPLSIDYGFLDEKKYFYYILVHMFMYLTACVMNDLAFDLEFTMKVYHLCALFKIVRIRLSKASDILSRVKMPKRVRKQKNFIDPDEKVNKLLKSAIDMHNEVLHMVTLIEEVYNLSWFVILIVNTIIFGITLLAHSLVLNNPLEFVRYIMAITMFFVHFYVIFSQGQRVINFSSSVFDACYNFRWYNAPKYSCTLLLLMMNRSFKPCMITGGNGMFILSMETYAHMLKFGYSMFTVLKSFQQ